MDLSQILRKERALAPSIKKRVGRIPLLLRFSSGLLELVSRLRFAGRGLYLRVEVLLELLIIEILEEDGLLYFGKLHILDAENPMRG